MSSRSSAAVAGRRRRVGARHRVPCARPAAARVATHITASARYESSSCSTSFTIGDDMTAILPQSGLDEKGGHLAAARGHVGQGSAGQTGEEPLHLAVEHEGVEVDHEVAELQPAGAELRERLALQVDLLPARRRTTPAPRPARRPTPTPSSPIRCARPCRRTRRWASGRGRRGGARMCGTRSISRPSRVVRPSSTRRVQGTWAAMAARSSAVNRGWSSSSVSTAKMAFLWMGLHRNGFTSVTARSFAACRSGCSSRVALQELVHEEPLVDDVDLAAVVAQPPALVGEMPGIADQGRVAPRLEEVAEEVVLGPRRHVLVVHDGDHRLRRRAAGLAVAGDERRQHRLPGVEALQPIPFLEPLHDRQLQEEIDEHLGVGDPRRALRVELDELIGVGGDERVQPRGRASCGRTRDRSGPARAPPGSRRRGPRGPPRGAPPPSRWRRRCPGTPPGSARRPPGRRGWAVERGTTRGPRKSGGRPGPGRGSAPRSPAGAPRRP